MATIRFIDKQAVLADMANGFTELTFSFPSDTEVTRAEPDKLISLHNERCEAWSLSRKTWKPIASLLSKVILINNS